MDGKVLLSRFIGCRKAPYFKYWMRRQIWFLMVKPVRAGILHMRMT